MKKATINRTLFAVLLSAVLSLSFIALPPNISPAPTVAAASSKLPAPTGIKTSSTSYSIDIKWDAVKDADGYKIYCMNTKTKNWGKWKEVSGNSEYDRDISAFDLKSGKTYYFKVAAVKNGKTGRKSSTIAVKTLDTATADKINANTFELYKKIKLPDDMYDGTTKKATDEISPAYYRICVSNTRTLDHYYEEIKSTVKSNGYRVEEDVFPGVYKDTPMGFDVYDSEGHCVMWVRRAEKNTLNPDDVLRVQFNHM